MSGYSNLAKPSFIPKSHKGFIAQKAVRKKAVVSLSTIDGNKVQLDLKKLKKLPIEIMHDGIVVGQVTEMSGVTKVDLFSLNRDLEIIGSISAENIELYTKVGVYLNAETTVKNEVIISAKTLEIQKPLKAHNLTITAKADLKINAQVELKCLNASASNIETNESVKTTFAYIHAMQDANFNAEFVARELATVDATNVTNINKLTSNIIKITAEDAFKNTGEIHACSFNTSGAIPSLTIKAQVVKDAGVTQSDGKLKVKSKKYKVMPEAKVSSKKIFKFEGEKISLKGKVDLNHLASINTQSFRSAGNIVFAENTSLQTSVLEFKTNSTLDWHQNEAVNKETIRVLKATDKVIIEECSNVNLKFSQLLTNDFFTAGRLSVESSFFKAETMRVASESKFNTNKSRVEINTCLVDGELFLTDSACKTHTTDIYGKVKLTHAHLKANEIFSDQQSEFSSEKDSIIEVQHSLNMEGTSRLNNSLVQAPRITNYGDSCAEKSTFKATQVLQSEGDLNLKECHVEAKSFKLKGKYDVQKTSAITDNYEEKGNGKVSNSTIKTSVWSVCEEAQSQHSENNVKSTYGFVSGFLAMNKTYSELDTLIQEKGTTELKGGTYLKTKKGLFTDKEAAFKMNSSKSESALASFSGTTNLIKSISSLKSADFYGTVNIDETRLEAKEQATFSGPSKISKKSILEVGEYTVQGVQTLSESVLKAKSAMVFGDLKANKSNMDVNNDIDNYGNIHVVESALAAANFKNNKKLKSEKSEIQLKQDFTNNVAAETQMVTTKMTCKNANISNVFSGTQSIVDAQKDIKMNLCAKVNANKLQMNAKGTVFVSPLSKVGGESLFIETDAMHNLGVISLTDTLKIDSETFLNELGWISGGKNTIIDSNKYLVNYFSHIGGNNVALTSCLNVNMLGDIHGRDMLQMQSFVDLNFLGSLRSYNANISSLIGCNAGLVLPSVPTSLSVAFSPQHLLSASKTILSLAMPKMASTINFSFMAGSLAYQSARSLFEVYKGEKKWTDMVPLYNLTQKKSWEMKDIVPTVLSIKNIGISAFNMGNSLMGMRSEISNFNWTDMKVDFDKFSWSSAAQGVAAVLGPNLSVDSAVGINAGVMLSQNIYQNDLVSVNTGCQVGVQSLVHNTGYMYNAGAIAGNSLVLSGEYFQNNGLLANYQKANLDFEHFHLGKSSQLYLYNGNASGVSANLNGNINIDNFNFDYSGDVNFDKDTKTYATNSSIQGKNVYVNGDIQYKEYFAIRGKEKVTLAEALNLRVDPVCEGAFKEVIVEKTADNNTVTNTKIEDSANLTNESDPMVPAVNEAETLDPDTKVKVPQNVLVVEGDQVIMEKGSHVTSDSGLIRARNADIDGNLKLANFKKEIAETLDIGNNAEIETRDCVFEANNINDKGKINYSGYLGINAMEGVAIKEGGSIAVASTESADNFLEVNGKQINFEKGSGIKTDAAVIKGETISVNSEFNAKNTKLEAEEHIELGEEATLQLKDVVVQGKNVANKASTTYSGSVFMQAKEEMDVQKSATMTVEEKTGDNYLEISGKTGKLEGMINSDRLYIKYDHIANAEDLIRGVDQYSQIQASHWLGVSLRDGINLDKAIQRDCGLSIEAHSMKMQTNYQTQYDLSFKSTTGDILLFGDLSAQNVYADSAASLYTTSKIIAKQDVGLTAKLAYHNVGGDVRGDRIFVKAGEVKNITRGSQVFNQLHSSLRDNAGNGGSFHGRITDLESTVSNIENHGGIIRGTEYLAAVAKRHIINESNVVITKGKYGERKDFIPAVLAGGTGINQDGIGLYLRADGKIINNASTIISDNVNYIEARQGFESNAYHHTYVSEKEKKRKWYGKKTEKEKTTTVVGKGQVIGNKNIFVCEEGGFKATAADFITHHGTEVYARDDIELYGLKYTDKKKKKTENLWGLNKHTKKETHEHVEPVVIYDVGVSRLVSTEGSIIGKNTLLLGDGDFKMSAKNGSVLFSADTLNHTIEEKCSGVSISTPLLDRYGHGNSVYDLLRFVDPIFDKANGLFHSNSASEWMANSWNLGLAAYNTGNVWSSAYRADMLSAQAMNAVGANEFFDPSINFTYSERKSKTNYQDTAPGAVHKRSLEVEAGDIVLFDGVDINVTEDMSVKAAKLELVGRELKSTYSYEEKSVTVGVKVTGDVVSGGGAYTKADAKASHWQYQNTHVGGNLHLEVQDVKLDAAHVDANTVTGDIGTLKITTRQDTYHNKSVSVSVSSGGQVSFSQDNSKGACTSETSSLHARAGINHDAEHILNVETTINHGGKITSDGVNNYKTTNMTNTEVNDYKKHRHIGISANVNSVVDALSENSSTSESVGAFKPIDVVSVSMRTEDFKASQQATYHGTEATNIQYESLSGQIHTADSDGYKVTKNKKTRLNIDVPVVNPNSFFAKKPEPPRPVTEQDRLIATDECEEEQMKVPTNEDMGDTTISSENNDVKAQSSVNVIDNNQTVLEEKFDSAVEEVSSSSGDPESIATQEIPDKNNTQRDVIADFAIEAGLDVTSLTYAELAEYLAKCGAKEASKIFKALDLGATYSAHLISENGNNNPNAVRDAALRTFADAIIMLPARYTIPLKYAGYMADRVIEQNEKWQQTHPELYRYDPTESISWKDYCEYKAYSDWNQATQEAVASAKIIKFFADLPKNAGDVMVNVYQFFSPSIESPTSTNNQQNSAISEKSDGEKKSMK